jgi:hypothetical protein
MLCSFHQVAVVVSTIYWTLILVYPQLILIKDPLYSASSSSSEAPPLVRVPLLIDLSLHATPALTLLADFAFFEKRYSKNATSYGAPFAVALATIGYATFVEYCAAFNGTCEYIFLRNSSDLYLLIERGSI